MGVRVLLCVLVSFVFVLSNPAQAQPDEKTTKNFHALLDAEWQWKLQSEPTVASRLGDRRYNDRWPDVSLAAYAKRHAHRRNVLKKLSAIDAGKLSDFDHVNYRLFKKQYETAVEAYPHGWHLLPLTQREGVQMANRLLDALRFRDVKDYRDWIARLDSLPTYIDQNIALMREGIKRGRVQAKVVMKRVPAQIAAQIVKDPGRSHFFKPFFSMGSNISLADQKQLQTDAKRIIVGKVVRAYQRFLEFFEDEYLPACYDRVGVWQMKGGESLYAFRARKFTTTNLTPKQIHDIGLKEVARIKNEMLVVMKRVKFRGSFKDFMTHLRTDPKFYYEKPDQLLNAYRGACKRIDAGLPKLFGRLPKIPYTIKAIPDQVAPDTTTAYYQPPAADGSRGGVYYVNLYKLDSRPKYEIEALSVHEAQPGHHLQIALQMELKNLPNFRRYGGYTAFIEGWGLYSEKLGEELGVYDEPYAKFGQLTYQMWRAIRLVVDTGMHNFQWSRQRAIDFFAANSPRSLLDIENEIDRYISWPGQALAYKIGELKIKDLRAKSEKALGKRFDIREFHDVVLAGGAVTLDVLEERIEGWLRKKMKREP